MDLALYRKSLAIGSSYDTRAFLNNAVRLNANTHSLPSQWAAADCRF